MGSTEIYSSAKKLYDIISSVEHILRPISVLFVTLGHKTGLKSRRHVCSSSQQYILWVRIIDFSFMPKITRILR